MTMDARHRVALFVPTYNTGRTVGAVLRGLPRELLELVGAVWVIDNRSGDGTIEEVLRLEDAPELAGKLEAYRNHENYFLGGSTVVALRMAIERGFDHLICLHSDGQADPRDALRVARLCVAEGDALVLGSRFMPGS